ncbi:MAG: hypothetical protein AB8G05_27620 [Oligoflexales bacterium]
MNKIIGIMIAAFSLTAFAGTKEETSVKLVKETMDLTIKCNPEVEDRQWFSKYNCHLSEIKQAAKGLADKNGGEYLNYEIIKAPEGFENRRYNHKENDLKVLVKYLK